MPIYQHTAVDRTPYTYLIGWKELDKWYFGVRYAKGCRPDEFWREEQRSKRSYNASSKTVDKFIKEHGQPDVRSVIDVFKSEEMARDYESRIIDLFDMVKDSRFLNKHNPKKKFYMIGPHSEEHCQRISKALKGIKRSEESNRRNSERQKGRPAWNKGLPSPMKGVKVGPYSPERCKSNSDAKRGTVHINNGVIGKVIKPEQLQSFLDQGWQRGRMKFKKSNKETLH